MKIALILSTLLASSQAFVIAPAGGVATQLRAQIAEDQMSENQLEIAKIQAKWNEVRHMSKDEAQSLEGEWKEAHDRFYEKYDEDMTRMNEIAEKIQKMIEPPKIQKKTKGQKRRDAFARKAARAVERTSGA